MDRGRSYAGQKGLRSIKTDISGKTNYVTQYVFFKIDPSRMRGIIDTTMKRILRSIYNNIPGKRHLFAIVRNIYCPPEHIYRHLHFKGVFECKLGTGEGVKIYHPGSHIENRIFWQGLNYGFEPDSIRLWMRLCRSFSNGDILDIGANTGIYTILAKASNPCCTVHAFEPHPDIYLGLLQNISINKMQVSALNVGVGSIVGNRSIQDFTGRSETIFASIVSIDNLIDERVINNPVLIKIDVEGYEVEVLKGFQKYINYFLPTILIEVLSDQIADKLETLLPLNHYRKFNISETGSIRETDRLTKSDCYNYLLCSASTAQILGL
jgi:FkbM family methyltransferase